MLWGAAQRLKTRRGVYNVRFFFVFRYTVASSNSVGLKEHYLIGGLGSNHRDRGLGKWCRYQKGGVGSPIGKKTFVGAGVGGAEWC